MSAVVIDIQDAGIQDVAISEDTLTVDLSDGRTISVPLAWYPRLWHGTEAERNNWRLIGRGAGIHWPDLDEDINVEGLIFGKPSNESQRSLSHWLEGRSSKPGQRSKKSLKDHHRARADSTIESIEVTALGKHN